jgi:hypothetical protein
MAVTNLQSNAIGFVHKVGPGMSFVLREGYEKASQSFKKGAVVIRDTGTIAIAAADATSDILGVADQPASGTTSAKLNYIPAFGNIFEATLEDQSNENHALVIANLYSDFAIQVDGLGKFYLDENDTTNTACMIVEAQQSDIAAATVRARVLCVFLADVLAQQT